MIRVQPRKCQKHRRPDEHVRRRRRGKKSSGDRCQVATNQEEVVTSSAPYLFKGGTHPVKDHHREKEEQRLYVRWHETETAKPPDFAIHYQTRDQFHLFDDFCIRPTQDERQHLPHDDNYGHIRHGVRSEFPFQTIQQSHSEPLLSNSFQSTVSSSINSDQPQFFG